MDSWSICSCLWPRATYSNRWSLNALMVNMAAMVPLFLVVIRSGEGAEESESCPLVTNGRLEECSAMAEKIFRYDDRQLYLACKQAEVQAWPRCLKQLVEDCRDLGYGDPDQIHQLHNMTISWQSKFDQMCATVVELHQSKGTASFISSSCPHWHTATWLPPLVFALHGLCLPNV